MIEVSINNKKITGEELIKWLLDNSNLFDADEIAETIAFCSEVENEDS
jgi:hypothetical protein